MDTTFEVVVWKFVDWRNSYAYEEYWRGQSVFVALWHLVKAKREGYGCVVLYWRP